MKHQPRALEMRRFYPEPPARAFDPNAYPRHRIAMTMYPTADEPGRVWFHTAGTIVLWSMPTMEVHRHPRIIAGMDPMDAFRLGLAHAHDDEFRTRQEIAALREAAR